jgi:hypothetical protein
MSPKVANPGITPHEGGVEPTGETTTTTSQACRQ